MKVKFNIIIPIEEEIYGDYANYIRQLYYTYDTKLEEKLIYGFFSDGGVDKYFSDKGLDMETNMTIRNFSIEESNAS